MPHQWLEGNISPGHKCDVCSKLCGSKKKLQDFACLWCDAVVRCLFHFSLLMTSSYQLLCFIYKKPSC